MCVWVMVLKCCDTCSHCAKAIHKHQETLALMLFHTTHHSQMADASWYCVPCHIMCPSFIWMAVGTVWLPEMGVVFVMSMAFTVSPFACAMIDNSGFTNLHSKCTSSTVILLPHLHQCVCWAWREIWCATHHAWLWVWSQGICVIVILATLLTLITICVVRWEPRSGVSAQCTSRVSTLLSHHLFPSINHGGCFIIKCVSLSIFFHVLLLWCWLCLKPVITKINDVACCCEKRLMPFWVLEGWHHQDMPIWAIWNLQWSGEHGLCLKCIYGWRQWHWHQSHPVLASWVHKPSLLFCTMHLSTKPLFCNLQCLWPLSSWHRHSHVVVPMWHGQPWGVFCCRHHSTWTHTLWEWDKHNIRVQLSPQHQQKEPTEPSPYPPFNKSTVSHHPPTNVWKDHQQHKKKQ